MALDTFRLAGPRAFSVDPWLNYPPLISEEPPISIHELAPIVVLVHLANGSRSVPGAVFQPLQCTCDCENDSAITLDASDVAPQRTVSSASP